MARFQVRQLVKIPCTIHSGTVSGERFITIDSGDEVISGFVRVDHLTESHVIGKIIGVESEKITVILPGSFFTRAAGRTTLPVEWANSNLQIESS